MLDNETKRRIDTARDILVGKVPDPKSQVEQITIALIYKFMDDMDRESIEMGGKATFFTGEYQKYAFHKLFDAKLGGHDTYFLYSEALAKLPLHTGKNFPQLFRDIFKNAYLPYRDPETLKLFLKTINEFTYDHSERLGDAFEYLLSVLGSQGDAGQFRTPRNIIDFMVEVMEPKKNETLCDPACGTAGFLISSYKHILNTNKKKHPGDLLTPDERKAIIKNFRGYDISPDMVRLSLVNLYLHHFTNPQIIEYDTLTSEDRWNESFDIIMANPPFMSPKGGIKPHKRFGVQSNRSEVLFLDYIAEHINPATGRAAVIVPEGIIFKGDAGYKKLRKMLVENNYLYGVVSLPVGVFNPYSGVKTSILLLDKAIAKKSDNILFIKILNDGFGLGAQRREVEGDDLPEALQVIKEWKKNPQKEITEIISIKKIIVQTIAKEKIAANGNYNLNGDRYRENDNSFNYKWDIVALGDYVSIENGNVLTDFDNDGKIACIKVSDMNIQENRVEIITSNHWIGSTEKKLLPVGSIVFPKRGAAIATNKKRITKIPCLIDNNCMGLTVASDLLLNKYLFYFLQDFDLSSISNSAGIALINNGDIKGVQIPLPPLTIQQQIVTEIERYQKVIDGARRVVDNYEPTIRIQPEWDMVELGEVCEKVTDSINPPDQKGSVNYVGLENIEQSTGKLTGDIKTKFEEIKSAKLVFKPGSILYGKLRPNLNKVWYSEFEGICSTDFFVLNFDQSRADVKFYSYYFLSEKFNTEVMKGISGAQLPRVNYEYFSSIEIPLPPLDEQQAIVHELEMERLMMQSVKQLIERMQQKIKDCIGQVWGGGVKKAGEYAENDIVTMAVEE